MTIKRPNTIYGLLELLVICFFSTDTLHFTGFSFPIFALSDFLPSELLVSVSVPRITDPKESSDAWKTTRWKSHLHKNLMKKENCWVFG